MRDKNNLHYSVLKQESIDSLKLSSGLTVVDATVNRAGHAEEIAKLIGKDGTIIIFDLDKVSYAEKIRLVFFNLPEYFVRRESGRSIYCRAWRFSAKVGRIVAETFAK